MRPPPPPTGSDRPLAPNRAPSKTYPLGGGGEGAGWVDPGSLTPTAGGEAARPAGSPWEGVPAVKGQQSNDDEGDGQEAQEAAEARKGRR